MDLALNEEQELLQHTAEEFLEKESPLKHVRAMEEDPNGFSPVLWKQVADLGWQGLIVPEAYGGSGGSLIDLCVLIQQMGKALFPSPFLPTVVPCASTIARAGSEEQKRAILPGVASGDRILTWAQQEPAAKYEPYFLKTAVREEGDQLVLDGTKLFVAFANVANDLLVVAKDGDGETLLIVDAQSAGISKTPLAVVDASKQYEVVFSGVKVPKANVIGERGKARPIIDRALQEWTVAICAWMVGGAEGAFTMAVEYSKTRVQFGRPIGSFQALQHKAADMAILVEGAKLTTYQAAGALETGDEPERAIAMAKAWTTDAFRKVCTDAHQMHGAIGFTWEYDLQLYTRRMRALENTLGDSDYHRTKVADAIGL